MKRLQIVLVSLVYLLLPGYASAQGGPIITTFAGAGRPDLSVSFSGDGGPATQSVLNAPAGVALDGKGFVYISDTQNHRVRRVGSDGIITTFAGNGTAGFSGDGGPATQASLNMPEGVAVDGKGNIYIVDSKNRRVRRVGPDGIITTFAGNGTAMFSGDGGQAAQAGLVYPYDVAVDAGGVVYIADPGDLIPPFKGSGNRIRRVGLDGVITTFAGNGAADFSGDGGPATQASLNAPLGVAVDGLGNVYIADPFNRRIRRVGKDGMITTFAGSGKVITGLGITGFSGDGGPATQAEMAAVQRVAVDDVGNVYISDSGNYRIRRVGTDGTITTIAGTGKEGFSGDGGMALQATLRYTLGMAVDPKGNIYIVDSGNHRIRLLNPTGVSSGQTPPSGMRLVSDFNGDGAVGFFDFFMFADVFGKRQGSAGFDAKFDLDGNGKIDFDDFFTFAADFGKTL